MPKLLEDSHLMVQRKRESRACVIASAFFLIKSKLLGKFMAVFLKKMMWNKKVIMIAENAPFLFLFFLIALKHICSYSSWSD